MDSKYGILYGNIDEIKKVIDNLRKGSPKSFFDVEDLIYPGCNEAYKAGICVKFKCELEELLRKYFKGDKELLQEIESHGEFVKEHGNPDFNIIDCINKVLGERYPDEVETFKTTGKVKFPNLVGNAVNEVIPSIQFKYKEKEILIV